MADAKFGSFDDLLEITEESQRQTATHLRELILSMHPEAVEVVRLGDRAASFGFGPKKMSEAYAYVLPYKSWVNLGFYFGAALPDPDNLMEGTGKKLRHIKMRSPQDADRPGVKKLIEAAMAERRAALGV